MNKAVVDILHRTRHFLVINKPPLCYSQPQDYRTKVRNDFGKEGQKTVLELVRTAYPDLYEVSPPFCEPKVVQRLDYQVSGAMVLATSEHAVRMFNRGLQNPKSSKGYKLTKHYMALLNAPYDTISHTNHPAVLWNNDKTPSGVINFPIDNKPAQTKFRLYPSCGQFTLAMFELITGRKHQLRVHSKNVLGSAIVGDQKFQIQDSHQQNQIALHAHQLDIHTNIQKRPLSVVAPINWGQQTVWSGLHEHYPSIFQQLV
ncbi:hypothetical protein TRICI_006287 [Trichomonascus ciferrii]|uniref:Pseudouridine synthase RsuA/RluA-like domain-containing protein n=1 Tax=Trichomonascus ciferrii TaxID=44093 RepID=A0A642UN58_9ASCO|nr:hypothetical protein TRICI_006287 [Trichomonascus ciferrii]